MTRRTFLAAGAGVSQLARAAPKSTLGIATTSFHLARTPDTYEFLKLCHELGAAGIQASLTSLEPEYLKKLRTDAEAWGMFIETMAGFRGGVEAFSAQVAGAAAVGALAIRATAPGPRRYESFKTLDDWKKAEAEAKKNLEAAAPVLAKHKIPLAIENHRDRTVDELVQLIRGFSHEQIRVCLDLGNNLALLDDPMEVVDKLLPYAVSTHIKDAGVAEIPDGFTLADAPLGEGFLDLNKMMTAIRGSNRNLKFTLEMMTRDPTPVPLLKESYWVAMPDRPGRIAARAMTMVRANVPKVPFAAVSKLDRPGQLALERRNVEKCLAHPLFRA